MSARSGTQSWRSTEVQERIRAEQAKIRPQAKTEESGLRKEADELTAVPWRKTASEKANVMRAWYDTESDDEKSTTKDSQEFSGLREETDEHAAAPWRKTPSEKTDAKRAWYDTGSDDEENAAASRSQSGSYPPPIT